jgi:tRNA(Ile)-lysidine synthase
MQRTIRRIRESEALYDEALDALKKKWFREENGTIRIERQKLGAHPASLTILHEWISPFGFSPAQLEQMLSEQTAVGALFYSSSHLLTVDRFQFLLAPLSEEQAPDHYLIEKQDFSLDLPDGKLQVDYPAPFPLSFKTPPDEILLDLDKLAFPLLLRRWKPGDLFHPFGMKGKRQKIKDYFINEKLSRIEKQKVWLLTSGGEICWVVGYRADERFRLDKESQRAVRIRWDRR